MMSLWPELMVEEGLLGVALVAIFLIMLARKLMLSPADGSQGIFVALAVVSAVSLLLVPTIWRADLWSLFAVSAILAESNPVRRPE